MSTIGKMGVVLLLSLGLALAGTASYAAEDHTDSGTEEGHSGGKGKGPKYMGGGKRGSSHTSETHKGGTSHHDSSEGGSTSLEDTIFRGKKPPGAGSGEDSSHETGEDSSHATGETDTEHGGGNKPPGAGSGEDGSHETGEDSSHETGETEPSD